MSGYCGLHGTYTPTTAGDCPQCGSIPRMIGNGSLRDPTTGFMPDGAARCDRCGFTKGEHNGIELFCPFYSTFRATPKP